MNLFRIRVVFVDNVEGGGFRVWGELCEGAGLLGRCLTVYVYVYEYIYIYICIYICICISLGFRVCIV